MVVLGHPNLFPTDVGLFLKFPGSPKALCFSLLNPVGLLMESVRFQGRAG